MKTDTPYTVSRVAPEYAPLVWPHLLVEMRRSTRKGAGDTLTVAGLMEGVFNGSIELWVLNRGVDIIGGVFLQIQKRERGKVLVVLDVVAGSGRGYAHYVEEMLPRVREYGQMIGVYSIEGVCRLGAARLLSRLGCKPKAVIMELNDGR